VLGTLLHEAAHGLAHAARSATPAVKAAATAAEAAMKGGDDSDQAVGGAEEGQQRVTSARERARLAKRRELAAYERAIQGHKRAAQVQERFGHPDRAATAREHAQHARELLELALHEQQEWEGQISVEDLTGDGAVAVGPGLVARRSPGWPPYLCNALIRVNDCRIPSYRTELIADPGGSLGQACRLARSSLGRPTRGGGSAPSSGQPEAASVG
jgi:hypothetical protein